MRKKTVNNKKKAADMSVVSISNTTISGVVALDTEVDIDNEVDNEVEEVIHDKFFNGKVIFKNTLFMDVDKKIPCTHFRVDSCGDLVMYCNIDGVVMSITETSDKNLAKELKANVFAHIEEGTHVSNSGTRAARTVINDNMIEIAESTLGTFRNYIEKNEDALKIIKSKRIYYVQGTNIRKDKDGPNTSHARLYYCEAANEVEAIALLKRICNANNQKLTIL